MSKRWSLSLKLFWEKYEYKFILLLYSSFPKWSPHTWKLQYDVMESLRESEIIKEHRVACPWQAGRTPLLCTVLGHLHWSCMGHTQEVVKCPLWLWRGNIWILFPYLEFVLILNQYVVLVILIKTRDRLGCWQHSYIPREAVWKPKSHSASQSHSVSCGTNNKHWWKAFPKTPDSLKNSKSNYQAS